MKQQRTLQKWKRARDTVVVLLAATSSLAIAGCIGVRDQLFQPLTAPPGGHPTLTFETDWRVRVEGELGSPAHAENAQNENAENAENPADRPETGLPDTKLNVEPPDEADELLLELDELRPDPVPLDRGETLEPDDHHPRSLEWRA